MLIVIRTSINNEITLQTPKSLSSMAQQKNAEVDQFPSEQLARQQTSPRCSPLSLSPIFLSLFSGALGPASRTVSKQVSSMTNLYDIPFDTP